MTTETGHWEMGPEREWGGGTAERGMLRGASRGQVLSHVALGIAILVFLVAKFHLLSLININWDEFLYLSRVHEFHRGELTTSFQTFHVHLFQWLVGVSGTEIDQMLAARHVVFGLRVGTSVLVFLLALRVSNRSGALVAVLATLAFSHLVRHGESFRADPLIAFLVLLSTTLLVWRLENVGAVTVAAIAFALAASITVKTALYVPALVGIAGVLWWQGDPVAHGVVRRRAVLFGAVGAAAYAALYLYHTAVIAAPGTEVVQRATASGAGMVGGAQFDTLLRTFRADWAFWLLFAEGAIVAARDAKRRIGPARIRPLLLLALLVPLASLVLYRNSFEYFYVAVVPFAALACAYSVMRAQELAPPAWRAGVPLVAAAVLAWRGWTFVDTLQSDAIEPQRRLVAAVHEIFPEPVPYLDRCAMMSSFPHAGLFMSTYVLQRYRERGVPGMARIVAEDQPHFLLSNVSALSLHLPWDIVRTAQHRLLREDFEFLQRNFVQHWGDIWVPGQRLALSREASLAFAIVVAGPYTVESERPVSIDGQLLRPGDVVELRSGHHRALGDGMVTLRFGARLPRPRSLPPRRRLFMPL